jgi:hypothetical protein
MTLKDDEFKNWPEPGQRLGGGLVLLPSNAVAQSNGSFALYKAISLAGRAFLLEPGLVADAMDELNLWRMDDVSQLQNLTVAEISDSLRALELPHCFQHKRLVHNLRAGALHGLMAKQIGLSEKETAVGILADCMHDTFIPAGGDSWKGVDHQGTIFDEDHNFAKKILLYCSLGWGQLCLKYGFDPEKTVQEIDDIVNGCGLGGQIHEIADTASYMLGDLEEIKKISQRSDAAISGLGGNFRRLLFFSEYRWDVWNHIKVEDGQLVITNTPVLKNFLGLRARLWADLYQNPAAKFLELLAREVVYPFLLARNLVDLSKLPLQSDAWLYDFLETETGLARGSWTRLDLLGEFPQRMAFAKWNEALEFEAKLHGEGAFTLVFSVEDFQVTKSKTDKYLVKDDDGKIVTFQEACPTSAWRIDEIAYWANAPAELVNVCWVAKPLLPAGLCQAWEEARTRWQKRK